MNWAQITKGVPKTISVASLQTDNTRKEAIDPPDISNLSTPDDIFEHRYLKKLMVLHDILKRSATNNNVQGYLLSEMTHTSLNDFAKCMTSNYENFHNNYSREVTRIYRRSNVKYRNVKISDDEENDSN